ncbi:MAG: NAD(P)H-binding protein, partial [Caldilinea sp.]|nr:NAD(P)H-binding protein [Caldilinea sp.]
MRVLVTGATGYVGGRLIPRLLERGHAVRVLVRDPRRIGGRPWADEVEVVTGNLLDARSIQRALDGVDAAYYLVHSMGATGDFAELDRKAATIFATQAHTLDHVIYLGGLLPQGANVSAHLNSRAEVGAILRGYCKVTEFRAGPVIGSGSASFEMVRYLTERLPIMVAPRWILNEVQPVAIRDVLSYLIAALERGPLGVVDIGSDRLTFKQMMQEYAAVRGLHRIIIPVPVP